VYAIVGGTDFSTGWQHFYASVRWEWYALFVTNIATTWVPSDRLPVTETTAHTLSATIGLLGLYQDIQDEVLHQILEVVGPTRDPVGFLILFLHLTD
jgi:hypothetical protein